MGEALAGTVPVTGIVVAGAVEAPGGTVAASEGDGDIEVEIDGDVEGEIVGDGVVVREARSEVAAGDCAEIDGVAVGMGGTTITSTMLKAAGPARLATRRLTLK